MIDMLGKEYCVGDYVAKAMYTGDLRIKRVTRVNERGVYLDRSTRPLDYPERNLIVTKVPNVEYREDHEA